MAPKDNNDDDDYNNERSNDAKTILGPRIETVLHPSPASPRANRGWKEQAAVELRAMGLCD